MDHDDPIPAPAPALQTANSRPSVLVVEDDEDTRSVLQLALEAEGYVVATARDGRDGIEQLRRGPRPDVLLTDLCMPVMSGHELIATKARDRSLASIPVVVLSAVARLTTPPAGAHVVLRKPLDLDRLIDTLASLCPGGAAASLAR